jgi:hypothetical protein
MGNLGGTRHALWCLCTLALLYAGFSRIFLCFALDSLAQPVDLLSLERITFLDKSSPNHTLYPATLKFRSQRNGIPAHHLSPKSILHHQYGVLSPFLPSIYQSMSTLSRKQELRDKCSSSANHVCAWPREYLCSAGGGKPHAPHYMKSWCLALIVYHVGTKSR